MKSCRFHQFLMSSALDKDGQLLGLTRAHLRGCDDCRLVWTRLKLLHGLLLDKGDDLCHQAVRSPLGIPLPDMNSAKKHTRRHANTKHRAGLLRPLMAMAAATLVLLLGIHWLRPSVDPIGRNPEQTFMDVKAQINTLAETLAKTSLDDPLERELQGLIGTARSAAGYLQSKVKKATGLNGDAST